jgi:hypothetical protein
MMRLSHVVIACDLNPDYLEFWPLTSQAWEEIVGIEPLLLVIGDEKAVPRKLRVDDRVRIIPPVAGVHTAFQAQCIRLLYPALMETSGGVLISDIDLFPLIPGYFHQPVRRLDERHFITYRDARLNRREVAIAYNAARPETWAEIFDVTSLDDVLTHLAEWAARVEYDGVHGGAGWYTDQHILYEKLVAWTAAPDRLWMLDDVYCGYQRLDRMELIHEAGLEPHRQRGIRSMKYSDYNCLVPYRAHQEVNDLVLELALEAFYRSREGRGRRALSRRDVENEALATKA